MRLSDCKLVPSLMRKGMYGKYVVHNLKETEVCLLSDKRSKRHALDVFTSCCYSSRNVIIPVVLDSDTLRLRNLVVAAVV